MRSSLIDANYWVPYCEAIFGKIGEPNIDYYIKKYGGLDITGNNIVFANAIEDPWQWAGMRQLQDPTKTQKNMKAILIDCNDCGHCVDLSTPSETDTPGLTLARRQIKEQLVQWINAKSSSEEPKLISTAAQAKQFLD